MISFQELCLQYGENKLTRTMLIDFIKQREKYLNSSSNNDKEKQIIEIAICDGKRSSFKLTEKEIWVNYHDYLEKNFLQDMFSELVDDGIDKDITYLLKYSVEEDEFVKQIITLTPVEITQ